MADQYLHEVIEDKLEEVRWALSRARLYKHEAEVHSEMDALYGPEYQDYGTGEWCFAEAKTFRLEVKKLLKEIEIINETLYLAGWKPILLREHLNGSEFRTWFEYRGAYNSSTLFCGLDPS